MSYNISSNTINEPYINCISSNWYANLPGTTVIPATIDYSKWLNSICEMPSYNELEARINKIEEEIQELRKNIEALMEAFLFDKNNNSTENI